MIRRISDSAKLSYRLYLGWKGKGIPVQRQHILYSTVVSYGSKELETVAQQLPADLPELDSLLQPWLFAENADKEKYDRSGSFRDVSSEWRDELKKAAEQRLLTCLPPPSLFIISSGTQYLAVYNNSLWSAGRELSSDQWIALIGNTLSREEAKLAAVARGRSKATPNREHISDEVRIDVWRRDAGQCVKCGSRERLEFDHIIPVAMGGSSTARNLQLLCEPCNRSKGASIT